MCYLSGETHVDVGVGDRRSARIEVAGYRSMSVLSLARRDEPSEPMVLVVGGRRYPSVPRSEAS